MKNAHFGTAIQISKNTRNTNRITAGNKYVWTVETFFKYFAKKGYFLWKESEIAIFLIFRGGLVVGKLLILKNEYPQYIIRIRKVSALPLDVAHFHS